MINGETGEAYPADIFVGCIFYQRLHHPRVRRRFTPAPAVACKSSLASRPKAVPVRVVFDSVRWSVTA